MLDNGAFAWNGELECLSGTKNYSDMTFDKLYGYDYQKEELIRNTEAFLEGKPANNVLLFGDVVLANHHLSKLSAMHFLKKVCGWLK